ncbi:DnaJ-domain-containing protein [Fistulina hepatica ATCC 64428]|nr:DnaJ-domain-containing protein [Fistulina hepatica ATCC 64428]
MDQNDPITQFFPDEEDVNLYNVLNVKEDATPDEIKKSYRRLALSCHPDKHANASESTKADMSIRFQQVGFAYSVLSDEKRRQRYDKTGCTDEGFEDIAGDRGWEAYFEELFDRVTRQKLDEMKVEYQGSKEEIADLKKAYNETDGSLDEIMNHVPHATHNDEERFISIISKLIADKELSSRSTWQSSTTDPKAKAARKKRGEKEAMEAEEQAKKLGVWDEFYGSGKTGERRGEGKGKKNEADDANGEGDTSALALLIRKKQKSRDSFFDGLAAKYAGSKPPRKGKKRGHPDDGEDPAPKRTKSNVPSPPDIDEEEFARLQAKLFKKDSAPGGKGKKKSGNA